MRGEELSHLPCEWRPDGRAVVLLRKSNALLVGERVWGGGQFVQCFSLLLVSSRKAQTVCDPSHHSLECSLELDTQVPITV